VEVSGAESAGLRGSSQHVRGDELVLLTRFFRILLGVAEVHEFQTSDAGLAHEAILRETARLGRRKPEQAPQLL
jgi:hypothetical protein